MQEAVKYSSLWSYMLKPSNLLAQGFENNRMAQQNLFKHMCNFGAQEDWRGQIIVVGSYPDVETTKDKCRLLNPTPMDYIAGYKMEDAIVGRALKRLTHRSLNFIDDSISNYVSVCSV